ncbi:MAG: family peptidase [Marmoricola sp.]|nr:family peptidase [Marmoricola sp.]
MLLASLAACGAADGEAPTSASPGIQPSTSATVSSAPVSPTTSPTASASPRRPQLSGRPVLGTAPPPWLGTRVLPRTADGFGEIRRTPPELVQRRFTLPDRLPALPGSGFASRVTTPAPADVIARSTWKPGCPVAAGDLSWVRVAFWGFDQRRHTGELLVNRSAAADLVQAFGQLYAARFPIEEMRITRLDELDVPPTGDGNNTGAFNCRVTVGATTYSQHAYGLAVDVNPFQNPYLKGDLVLPELASSYRDRGFVRPGMITAGGPVVRAFDSIGWTWGGTWSSLKDLQHFSANGR